MPTIRNVQLGCKRHLLADFGDAAGTRIVQEPLEVEDKNRRECVNVHRLGRVQRRARPRDRRDLHRLWRRNARQGIFDRVNLFALPKEINPCTTIQPRHAPECLIAATASLQTSPSLSGAARVVPSGISRQTCVSWAIRLTFAVDVLFLSFASVKTTYRARDRHAVAFANFEPRAVLLDRMAVLCLGRLHSF